MRVPSLAVIFLAGTVAFAQKSDLRPIKRPVITPHATHPPLSKSASPDVAAAALKRKSSTANNLTQIERSSMVHAGGKTTSTAKGVGAPNNVPAYKNKPMNASSAHRNVGKQIPTVHKKTGKVG